MLPIEAQLFLCGFLGSMLVEVLKIVRYYESSTRLPMRYKKIGFWFFRLLLACAGGVFAILYNPASLLLAVHIGVSTPLLVATLTETLPSKE
ncbi:hypothetical protein JCM14076_29220 [Methylosoma difficile]